MKSQVFETLRQSPVLGLRDGAVLLVAALLWYGAVSSRNYVIHPICPTQPEHCSVEQIPSLDRFLVHSEDPQADHYSFVTQNTSGILALLVTLFWALRRRSWVNLATDWLLLFQTTMVNGLFTELTRLVVQRPRPYVFVDPMRGQDAANYTAFYSGHTSFAATASTALWLILLSRGAPRWMLALFGASGFTLVFLTAVYRVLAGRHFITDTIAGALAGFLVAWFVAWIHRPKISTGPTLA
jgi:membrane-associated phospholipid phosphatase